MIITCCGFSEITKFCGTSKTIADITSLRILRVNFEIFMTPYL